MAGISTIYTIAPVTTHAPVMYELMSPELYLGPLFALRPHSGMDMSKVLDASFCIILISFIILTYFDRYKFAAFLSAFFRPQEFVEEGQGWRLVVKDQRRDRTIDTCETDGLNSPQAFRAF
jgi:hypothetical protein